MTTRPAKPRARAPRAKPPAATTEPQAVEVSRAIREEAQAQLAHLELAERLGGLVSADVMREEIADMVTACRSRILAIPSIYKQRVPRLTLDEVDILTQLVRDALDQLNRRRDEDDNEYEPVIGSTKERQ